MWTHRGRARDGPPVTCDNAPPGLCTEKKFCGNRPAVAVPVAGSARVRQYRADMADRELRLGDEHSGVVEVRRSARRRRTISAFREGDRTVVLVPARLSRAEEDEWVATMLARLASKETRRRPGDGELLRRARELSRRHLDGRARPTSVRWVSNQRGRWGSCTPADGTIRLSDRLQRMPGWVTDYVLVHELAHLLVADHSPAFWTLVDRYPMSERARGYLQGVVDHAGTAAPDDLGTGLDDDLEVDEAAGA